ncbi:hypothetical protein BD289DRAFT_108746 [Coniella lustricola]|uniref:Uncharacterized protein n=1 Tax=Coniella lustricola TaxID=2025994 RepID=A0A2T2ZXJ9_9PEZI|nr:hypothetical protein BD289DRAFT_108746 [Coniella lustricola]
MISAQIAGYISDLSICQCLVQLDSYQPWASSYESQMVGHQANIHRRSPNSFSPCIARCNGRNHWLAQKHLVGDQVQGKNKRLNTRGRNVQPIFAVDSRAYKVSRIFFIHLDNTSSPGGIKWTTLSPCHDFCWFHHTSMSNVRFKFTSLTHRTKFPS